MANYAKWYPLCLLLLASCGGIRYTPVGRFDAAVAPAPNYADPSAWAALPTKTDYADRLPDPAFKDGQGEAVADVFFVHPTIMIGNDKSHRAWNANLADTVLNQSTDQSTILHQASAFNGAGRIYAPRYRQAHLYIYYANADQRPDAQQALNLAYNDVKAAFEYYLKHYHNGRPIIIASHSQGTNHAERLLLEYFDQTDLRKYLVAAYLVGMPIPADTFKTIQPCQYEEQTGCFCSWNTYAKGFYPDNYRVKLYRALATNPLTWTTDDRYADRSLNEGGLLPSFKLKPQLADAQAQGGMVWVRKPRVWYRAVVWKKNWHVADYNLFYASIRNNAMVRVNSFMRQVGRQ